MRSSDLAAVLFGALLFASGCTDVAADLGRKGMALTSQSRPYDEFCEDPVALSTIKTVAIIPFDNAASAAGFDGVAFATRFANQLASRGQLRVFYPKQVLEYAERENAAIRRHNSEYEQRQLLGVKTADDRADRLRRAQARGEESIAGAEDKPMALVNPVRNLEDAIRIGRRLGADAVMMGEVHDYDPYMRPRISIALKAIATGQSEAAAQALAELTQWGIPRSGAAARGVVWSRQQNFDSRDGNVGLDATMEAMTHHVDNHPYDKQSYLRSPTLYADFVGASLAKAILKAREDSVKEAERRALEEARRLKASQEAVRNRLARLTAPDAPLPDGDATVAANLPDRRERGWRPDAYNLQNAKKSEKLYGPGQIDPAVAPGLAPGAQPEPAPEAGRHRFPFFRTSGKAEPAAAPQAGAPSAAPEGAGMPPADGAIGPGMTGF